MTRIFTFEGKEFELCSLYIFYFIILVYSYLMSLSFFMMKISLQQHFASEVLSMNLPNTSHLLLRERWQTSRQITC